MTGNVTTGAKKMPCSLVSTNADSAHIVTQESEDALMRDYIRRTQNQGDANRITDHTLEAPTPQLGSVISEGSSANNKDRESSGTSNATIIAGILGATVAVIALIAPLFARFLPT